MSFFTTRRRMMGGSSSGEQLIHYQMLYDAGDPCTQVTGGYTSSNSKGTVSISPVISLSANTGNYNYHARVVSNQAINLSGYACLGCCCTAVSQSEQYITGVYTGASILPYNAGFSTISASNIPGVMDKISPAVTAMVQFTTAGVQSADISSLESQYVYASAGCNSSVAISHIWLAQEDDWSMLCAKAGEPFAAYSSVEALCADSTAMAAILGTRAAVRYMCLNCTGTFMTAFIGSSVARAALQNSAYSETIYANPHWSKFLMMNA